MPQPSSNQYMQPQAGAGNMMPRNLFPPQGGWTGAGPPINGWIGLPPQPLGQTGANVQGIGEPNVQLMASASGPWGGRGRDGQQHDCSYQRQASAGSAEAKGAEFGEQGQRSGLDEGSLRGGPQGSAATQRQPSSSPPPSAPPSPPAPERRGANAGGGQRMGGILAWLVALSCCTLGKAGPTARRSLSERSKLINATGGYRQQTGDTGACDAAERGRDGHEYDERDMRHVPGQRRR